MHGYLPSPKNNVEYAGEISFSFYCLWVWAYQCKRLTLLVMEVRPLIRDAFIYYSIKLRNFLCASYDNPIRMNIRPFGSCGWLVTKTDLFCYMLAVLMSSLQPLRDNQLLTGRGWCTKPFGRSFRPQCTQLTKWLPEPPLKHQLKRTQPDR